MVLQARPVIDAIRDDRERVYCQLSYLTASRVNELCGIGSVEKTTSPVGPTKEDVTYDSYENTKALLIQIHIEKRRQDKGIPPTNAAAAVLKLPYQMNVIVGQLIK